MYRHHKENFSKEELYLKSQLVALYHELGHVGGFGPSDLESITHLKKFIQIRGLVNAKSKGEKKKTDPRISATFLFSLEFHLMSPVSLKIP